MLLYTDGLIERHGSTLDDGMERLVDSSRDWLAEPLEELCDALLERMLPGTPQDDVAIVAVRISPSAPRWRKRACVTVERGAASGQPARTKRSCDERGARTMGRLAWPLRPLPDGRGEVWRWDLGTRRRAARRPRGTPRQSR